ncbi:MAG: glycosyltransferase family 2 protein [Actinomycetota bacterium]|nr:glycosyltransferase family 2 protein [Actinomycetota bacterium]
MIIGVAAAPLGDVEALAVTEGLLSAEYALTVPAATVPEAEVRHPELSVIVPAYRDSHHIVESLARLRAALDSTGATWELIVVVDGDSQTYREASAIASPSVRVFGSDRNRGKGFALRCGMAHSAGDYVTFIDSDMEIAPEGIGRMMGLMRLYDADIVVGSKRHPMSKVQYPLLRRVQSASYHRLCRMLFRVKVRDTQTGLKIMRRQVSEDVLRVALVKRFAFDLELLTIADHLGYRRIMEAPVEIDYKFSSTTNGRAVFWVLLDTAAIFYRLHIRRTYAKEWTCGRDRLDETVLQEAGLQ